jgi:hypothetical protein
MGFIQKYWKKIRNSFHIPGEDIILLGLDDRNHSIRIYDLFVKTGPKFESKMESKVIEGNVAEVFLWYARKKLDHTFYGEYKDPKNPNIVTVSFEIDKTKGDIFKTDDKPEGIIYPVDMQTGQGAMLLRKEKKESLLEDVDPVVTETEEVAGPEFLSVTIPQQIVLKRDPVLELLVSVNPYLLGSTIDSFFATELLRGKVEMWKTAVIALGVGVMAFIVGLGM